MLRAGLPGTAHAANRCCEYAAVLREPAKKAQDRAQRDSFARSWRADPAGLSAPRRVPGIVSGIESARALSGCHRDRADGRHARPVDRALHAAPDRRGRPTTALFFNLTGTMAGAALLPFAVSLGIDHYAVFERLFGQAAGYIAGAAFLALALLFWYGLEYLIGRVKEGPMSKLKPQEPTPISTKIEEMLTEARVVLPGAQALLGFQLAVTLTHAFEELPFFSKLVHAVALILVALAVILLMAPAAFHRIAFAGEDNEDFHRIGSWFIVAATVPLAG